MNAVRYGIFALALALAAPVVAQSMRDQAITALENQGYVIVDVGRTLLGRLRIVAEDDTVRREIVLNPSTGEILRDYAVLLTAIHDPADGLGFEDGKPHSTDTAAAARVPGDEAATETPDAPSAAPELATPGPELDAIVSDPLVVGD